ncbi:hypothetical protein BCR41DRAFT_161847 [Lobosporangium transversale]|uniref:Uncharacterized protein n=1 Tax=Lobosporangium transversale TaxID=64571 RepID=A0A1Y2GH01_9FUNG|nr:hypothetical protein BCR41DRAFT_161847 [Lobosporangium transversale]ORZ07257.1 hypothetical protein BCR41DRAFT_161847 [Lobosporangium transversale]|eukprot:XP_021877920.1 hypothetical protein BCR41DRAFT_161847 [Lobosporangium transversale]
MTRSNKEPLQQVYNTTETQTCVFRNMNKNTDYTDYTDYTDKQMLLQSQTPLYSFLAVILVVIVVVCPYKEGTLILFELLFSSSSSSSCFLTFLCAYSHHYSLSYTFAFILHIQQLISFHFLPYNYNFLLFFS